MNTNRPLQNQLKNLLDEHGVQILYPPLIAGNKLIINVQDVVSGQKATLELPFGKEV